MADKTQKEKIEEEIEAVAEELFQWELMPVTSYPESATDVMISIENKRRENVCLAKRKTFIKYAYYLIDLAIKETEERMVREIEAEKEDIDDIVEPCKDFARHKNEVLDSLKRKFLST